MNKLFLRVIGTLAAVTIAGCVSSSPGGSETRENNGSTSSVTCGYRIEYSGYQVSVEGVGIPLGGKTINIAKVFVTPQKIQEAQAVTQALDVLQFNQCQTMLLLPIDRREEYVRRREQTLAALTQALKAIDESKNAIEYNKAVTDAESQKDKIVQGKSASADASPGAK